MRWQVPWKGGPILFIDIEDRMGEGGGSSEEAFLLKEVKVGVESNLWIEWAKYYFETEQMNFGLLMDMIFIIASHYKCTINNIDLNRLILDIGCCFKNENEIKNRDKAISRILPLVEKYMAYELGIV